MYPQCPNVLGHLSFKCMEWAHSDEKKTFLDENKNVILWYSLHHLFSRDRQYFSSLWLFGYSNDLPPNSVFKISFKVCHYHGMYVHNMCMCVGHWHLCGVNSLLWTSCGFWGWNSGLQACRASAFLLSCLAAPLSVFVLTGSKCNLTSNLANSWHKSRYWN